LVECERAKERLSSQASADITVADPDTGAVLGADLTRDEFEKLLKENEVLARINRTLRNALNAARERGYDEDAIHTALLVGGSSQIPCVRSALQDFFGKDRVLLHRPLDAIARGAAAFVAGVDFYDHIQHAYSIRYIDSKKGQYAFEQLVPRGAPYPTHEPLARKTVKATYDGQTQLGIAIFEMGQHRQVGGAESMELVFDPSGAARVLQITPDEQERRTHFWINEHNPTFLEADPPARQGEARFEVEFGIDGNKRLLITARDVRSNQTVLRNYPVVKLT
jgi:molecular chaperone DnaK (HSP70)